MISATPADANMSAPSTGADAQHASAFSIVMGVALALVIFFAIAGNLLVCVAVYSDRNLRKIANLFIVSLALADLLVATLVMPFALANDLLGYWAFDVGFCNVWVSFDIMCSTASILNLSAISADRYVHIRDPLRYHANMRARTALCAIFCVWLCSFVISFVPINLGWHEIPVSNNISGVREQEKVVAQEEDVDSSPPMCALEINPTYAILSSAISFYAPCVVMVFIYMRLYAYARRHVRSIKALSVPPSTNGGAASVHSRQWQDHKAAITLGVIMGVFLLCWTPFFCVNIVAACCAECVPKVVFVVLTWLGYFNSTMNPIIYSIFNTDFREAFKRILAIDRCRLLPGWHPPKNSYTTDCNVVHLHAGESPRKKCRHKTEIVVKDVADQLVTAL
ncbi:PREDICTED: dopamine receptor 1-like [Priapulus caudatus]|uniref:Dopamine receptor 1-like n=1 Tax=Priapulus caudatus TaxID=37621 RepID=A0ABM1E1G5_PRICU|nr:PREDICTED: dopamine receptor 1-like [Priapulus caudatus]